MSEKKTLEQFQELECRSRNMGPFEYLPLHKRRDITIIAWQSFHDQEMKAKDAEIESLKQQLSEFKREYKILSDNSNCECGSGQQNDGDTDLLGTTTCSNCGNTIKL